MAASMPIAADTSSPEPVSSGGAIDTLTRTQP